MLKEFREFALKGNMVDLAIGVIIGAAFSGLVQSVVNDIIMPIIGLITGGIDFSQIYCPDERRTRSRPSTRPARPARRSPTAISSRW